jgi:hypothetical protein
VPVLFCATIAGVLTMGENEYRIVQTILNLMIIPALGIQWSLLTELRRIELQFKDGIAALKLELAEKYVKKSEIKERN